MKKLLSDLNYLTYEKQYDREYTKINYNRLIPNMLIIYLIEWIVFLYSDLFMGVGDIILYFQFYCTVLIPIILFYYKKFDSTSIVILKLLLYMYLLGIILFGIALVFSTQHISDLVHMFMMITLGVCSIIFMPPKESFFIIGLSTIIFFIGIPFFQTDLEIVNVNKLNSFIFNLIAWFLSCNLFIFKIKDLYLHKELEANQKYLLKLSQLDQMTNIQNRNSILDILSQEMNNANKCKEDLGIILLDIDDFKNINDQFGHLMGDTVIIEFSNKLKETIGSNSLVGRYGGEEFLIVLPNCNIEYMLSIFQKLKDSLHHIEIPDKRKVTVSAGIALYENTNIKDFIKKADQRLYEAKRKGKANCVWRD